MGGFASQFAQIQEWLGEPTRPVVRDTSSNANPFGPSLLYAYRNIVFEVRKIPTFASLVVIMLNCYCDAAVMLLL